MDKFDKQAKDALAFLHWHSRQVRRIKRFQGVEAVELDFAVAAVDVPGKFYRFSEDLVKEAGRLGVGLELSIYRVAE